ncbi:hypothetical protein BJ165DRAFT_1132469 [Panaeolus papilionaceus]|nr:hypothetical protein BJ165DRAFT_1132469 [Panaeolus papilionaceus]
MLARDESMFYNMFSLPNAEHDETSDDSPLVLQDEPENIHSLLWILYAPKTVASAASDITRGNIDRLIRCLEMANKYHFGSIETWALETLRVAFLDSEMKHIGEDEEASHAHDTTQHGFTFGMLVRVTKMTNQIVSEQASSLKGALHIIEANDLRLPRGLVYHNILANQASWRDSPLLNREQKVNLLAGYHKLQETKCNAERLDKLPHYRHSSTFSLRRLYHQVENHLRREGLPTRHHDKCCTRRDVGRVQSKCVSKRQYDARDRRV